MSTFLQDLRFAVRTLRRAPGFSAVAILTLGLGIGVTAAMFSWLMVMITAANPARDMSRLAAVWSHNRTQGETKNVVSLHDFTEWRRRQQSFDRFSALRGGAVNLSGTAQPVRASAQFVTADYFDVLDRQPVLGRPFRPEEERSATVPVVILSNRFWREQFQGRPDAIGREVQIDGRAATIVGVMPPDDFSDQLILPLTIDPASPDYGNRAVFVFARMKPGVSLEQARADMASIGESLQRELPDTHRGWGVNTLPLSEEFIGPQARIVFGLMVGAALAVLLIGCANVANLLLARSLSRGREMAVRTALGASRGRLIRQMLAESLVLAIAGGAAGVVVAYWSLATMRGVFSTLGWIMDRMVVDGPVLAFAAVAAVGSTLVFGILPAWQSARAEVNENLRDGTRTTGGRHTRRLRAALVASEVAMAVLFLVVSMLFMRTLTALQRIEPGFDTTNLLTMRVSLPDARYATDAGVISFFDRAVERVRESRGVIASGATARVPAAGSRWNPNRSMVIEGRPPVGGETLFAADLTVTPGYLETMRFPLRTGRMLQPNDGAGAPLAVVVSDATVRRYFSGSAMQAVGARIRLGDEPSATWRTIVGVVGDVRNDDIDAPPLPMVYVPFAQRPAHEMTIVLRTTDDPLSHIGDARAAVAAVDPAQPIYEVKTMAQILEEDLRQSVLLIGVIGIFALMALVLAGLGIYGVIAHAVAQRTNEIGVRMALGATLRDGVSRVVRQGIAPVGFGLAIGMLAGLGASRLIGGMLYGVTPTDPVTYGLVALVLVTVALAACVMPARRAARIDPLLAIRSE